MTLHSWGKFIGPSFQWARTIAEGFEAGGNRVLIPFLATAKGSADEIKDQLCCAWDEAYTYKD